MSSDKCSVDSVDSVDSVEVITAHEAFQRFDTEGEFAQGQGSFSCEARERRRSRCSGAVYSGP